MSVITVLFLFKSFVGARNEVKRNFRIPMRYIVDLPVASKRIRVSVLMSYASEVRVVRTDIFTETSLHFCRSKLICRSLNGRYW